MSLLLPDYLRNALDKSHSAEVARHLENCSDCAAQCALWGQLGEIPNEKPSLGMKRRFETMLTAYQEGRWEHDHRASLSSWASMLSWWRSPVAQAAMAMLLLVAGFSIGHRAQQPVQTSEFVSLHRELATMRQLVVLSMLQQQSASERLQGVSRTYQLIKPDPEIVDALVRSLKTDSSVDVRLAALDSLRRYRDDLHVRRGLVESLTVKQSPLVQIALIDALVEMRDDSAVARIKEFQNSKDVSPVVRERAQWGVAKLSRG